MTTFKTKTPIQIPKTEIIEMIEMKASERFVHKYLKATNFEKLKLFTRIHSSDNYFKSQGGDTSIKQRDNGIKYKILFPHGDPRLD